MTVLQVSILSFTTGVVSLFHYLTWKLGQGGPQR